MIKWYCDLCKKEIEEPEHPEILSFYCEGKNRDDAEIGWGKDIFKKKICCHQSCAEIAMAEIKAVLEKIVADFES